MYFFFGGGLILTLLFLVLIIKKLKIRKKGKKEKTRYRNKIKKNLKRIRPKIFLIVLSGLMLTGILFIGKRNITGFAVGGATAINNNWNILGFVLIIGMLGLLIFIYRKKIIEKIETRKGEKHSKNSIKGLIKKKVYTEEGIYFGKIKEIILRGNKIDSFKIKLDKKQKFKIKGIIVKYKNVQSIGHIMIVDEKILEKFKG